MTESYAALEAIVARYEALIERERPLQAYGRACQVIETENRCLAQLAHIERLAQQEREQARLWDGQRQAHEAAQEEARRALVFGTLPREPL